jgi:hypothetical protein
MSAKTMMKIQMAMNQKKKTNMVHRTSPNWYVASMPPSLSGASAPIVRPHASSAGQGYAVAAP